MPAAFGAGLTPCFLHKLANYTVDTDADGYDSEDDGALALMYGASSGSSSGANAEDGHPEAFAHTAELAMGRTGAVCHRPRLLVYGAEGRGTAVLGEALLHVLEELPIFSLDMAGLIADPVSRCAEGAFCGIVFVLLLVLAPSQL
jgi:hypothetical protein